MDSESYQRLRALFHALCDLPADAQRAALDEQDLAPALRAELEGLLGHEPAPGPLEETSLGRAGEVLVEGAGATSDDALPERIGRYRVVRKIGEGGMGLVYAARRETSDALVAVKVIRPGLAARDLAARFVREAGVLERLRHPGIAAFYDSGEARVETASGTLVLPFLAMELVEGEPLLRHAERAGLDDDQRLELLARVCDAVHHAHELGVLHRDLKPGNLLVKPLADGVGQPKVLDFGIARVTGIDFQTMTMTATASGAMLGTVPYMSPEQVGSRRELDARSDVYSLGVVLFELLAGRLPYEVTDRSLLDAARVIQEEEPTRLGSVVARLRGPVEVIVAKALEKDPGRRYASAAALATDLRRHLRGEPLEARPPTWSHQVGKFARRHKVLVGTLSGTFLALLAGLVASLWFALGEGHARRAADASAAEARSLAYRVGVAGAAAELRLGDVFGARRRLAGAPPELRGWEWHHLASRLDPSVLVLDEPLGPDASPAQLVFTPDGRAVRMLYLDLERGSACLSTWRLDDGSLAERRMAGVAGVEVDPDGLHLYRLTADSTTLEVVRIDDGSVLSTLPVAHEAAPRLGESVEPGLVLVFDASTATVLDRAGDRPARELSTVPAGEAPYLMASGRHVVQILAGRSVRVRDLDSGGEGWILPRSAPARGIALDPSGTRLAVWGEAQYAVEIWELGPAPPARPLAVFRGHTDTVLACTFSPDGRRVASAGDDAVLRLWDPDTGAEWRALPHEAVARRLAFSPDGALLAAAVKGEAGRPSLVLLSTERDSRSVEHAGKLRALDLSANGARAFVGGLHCGVSVFDVASGLPVATYPSPPNTTVFDVEIAPDDRWFAMTEWTPQGGFALVSIVVVDVVTGARRTLAQAEVRRDGRGGAGLALAPRGDRLAACPSADGVVLWDTATWEPVARQPDLAPVQTVLEFAPDGGTLAVSGRDGEIHLLDGEDLTRLRSWRAHERRVWDLDFHPDGRSLVSASTDTTARAWNLADPGEGVIVHDGNRIVFTVAHSPDGSRVVVAGDDRTVALYTGDDYGEIVRLPGHGDAVREAVFDRDGRRLVTASGDWTARIWGLDTVAERMDARREYREIEARLAPRVEEWARAAGQTGALERLRSERDLSDREREIGLQLLMRRAR